MGLLTAASMQARILALAQARPPDTRGVPAEISDPRQLVRRFVHRVVLEFQAIFLQMEPELEEIARSRREQGTP